MLCDLGRVDAGCEAVLLAKQACMDFDVSSRMTCTCVFISNENRFYEARVMLYLNTLGPFGRPE